ncbi:MAG: hypothetical protein WDW36_008253 [Sanguina aurantia]
MDAQQLDDSQEESARSPSTTHQPPHRQPQAAASASPHTASSQHGKLSHVTPPWLWNSRAVSSASVPPVSGLHTLLALSPATLAWDIKGNLGHLLTGSSSEPITCSNGDAPLDADLFCMLDTSTQQGAPQDSSSPAPSHSPLHTAAQLPRTPLDCPDRDPSESHTGSSGGGSDQPACGAEQSAHNGGGSGGGGSGSLFNGYPLGLQYTAGGGAGRAPSRALPGSLVIRHAHGRADGALTTRSRSMQACHWDQHGAVRGRSGHHLSRRGVIVAAAQPGQSVRSEFSQDGTDSARGDGSGSSHPGSSPGPANKPSQLPQTPISTTDAPPAVKSQLLPSSNGAGSSSSSSGSSTGSSSSTSTSSSSYGSNGSSSYGSSNGSVSGSGDTPPATTAGLPQTTATPAPATPGPAPTPQHDAGGAPPQALPPPPPPPPQAAPSRPPTLPTPLQAKQQEPQQPAAPSASAQPPPPLPQQPQQQPLPRRQPQRQRQQQQQPQAAPFHLWQQFLLYREILTRSAVTLAMLTVIRAGGFIPLPGVDLNLVPVANSISQGEALIKALYGQARELPASIFDLGISPYISASILVTAALSLPPDIANLTPCAHFLANLREMRKEGKRGEAHLKSYVAMLALAFGVYSGVSRAQELAPYAIFSSGFVFNAVAALVAGSCIINFCAEVISAHGIGNGSSLVICCAIISDYTGTIHSVLTACSMGSITLARLAPILVGYVALVACSILLHSSELRLRLVQYSMNKRLEPGLGGAPNGDLHYQARQLADSRAAANKTVNPAYYPIKLNSSGMMPIIIAGAVFYGGIPMLLKFAGLSAAASALVAWQGTTAGLCCYGLTVTRAAAHTSNSAASGSGCRGTAHGLTCYSLTVGLIPMLCYSLVALMEFLPMGGLSAKDVVDYFGALNVGIKGCLPGEQAEKFLTDLTVRCKTWGGLALGLVAVAAQAFDMYCLRVIGTSLSTASLLIIVGTALMAARQVESLMQGPSLQRKLDAERRIISSLTAI